MREWIKKRWDEFVNFNKTRLVANLLSMSDDEFRVKSEEIFNSTKKLSDFVGMIVRLTFAQFAWRYFMFMSPKTDGIYGYIFGFCAIFTMGLTVFLGSRIFLIIFAWEVEDVRQITGSISRGILFVIAALSTLTIYLGTLRLVSDMARASALLGTN